MSLLEAAKQAREALRNCYNVQYHPADGTSEQDEAIRVLSSAISEAEAGDKPVAWLFSDGLHAQTDEPVDKTHFSPLFLVPPTAKAKVQAALTYAANLCEAQYVGSRRPFGARVCADAIRAVRPEDVLEGGK
jgi:hypothetical protein